MEPETCAYCGSDVEILHQDPNHMGEPCEVIPPADDDSAWAELAEQHADGCEWIATRAHQLT